MPIVLAGLLLSFLVMLLFGGTEFDRGLFVLLHTSLSGVFNQAMVERVGADDFVPKYSEHDLAERIAARVAALA